MEKANYDEARMDLEKFDWISHLSNYDVNKKWVHSKNAGLILPNFGSNMD